MARAARGRRRLHNCKAFGGMWMSAEASVLRTPALPDAVER